MVPKELGMSYGRLVSDYYLQSPHINTSVFMMSHGTNVNTGGIAPSQVRVERSPKYGNAAVHATARATGLVSKDQCGVQSWRPEVFEVAFVTGVKRRAIVKSA